MEQLLLEYHRTRDRRLREQIVARYGWLARAVAGQMKRPGEDLDDLVQVASIGILKAIERFDPALGSFRSYASTTARGEVKRHYRDHAWSVSVPRRLKDLRSTVAAATEVLQERLRRSPTPDEVATYLRIPRDDVDACIAAGANFRALPLTAPDGSERPSPELVAPDWEQGLVSRLHAERGGARAPGPTSGAPADRRPLALRRPADPGRDRCGDRRQPGPRRATAGASAEPAPTRSRPGR